MRQKIGRFVLVRKNLLFIVGQKDGYEAVANREVEGNFRRAFGRPLLPQQFHSLEVGDVDVRRLTRLRRRRRQRRRDLSLLESASTQNIFDPGGFRVGRPGEGET